MGKKNSYNYLVKNIGLLALSNFATKILSFFLVPLYTSVLSTEDYGTYDLFNTTILLLVPIMTLNISEAVLRFSMDRSFDKNAITIISFKYFLSSTIAVLVFLMINNFFGLSKAIDEYAIFFLLMYITQALNGIVTYYARGTGHIAELSISSVVSSAVIIFSNIMFLLVLNMGLYGYFIANIVGPLIQSIYLTLKLGYISKVRFNKKYILEKKEMTRYSVPLVANAVVFWINSASDKYVVIWAAGLSANGIYSVASKIPSILNVFQTIFAQAWTLSVVKDYDPEDKNGFFKSTYNLYNGMMVIVCSGVILFDKFLAKILYAKDFYTAWRYVPFLTIAIVFSSMSGYIGGFFSAVKDSRVFAQSTLVGAVINLVLNIIFTPIVGPIGAAVATTISFAIIWLIRLFTSRKYINLRINLPRDILAYLILMIQGTVLNLVDDGILLHSIESVLFAVIVLLYFTESKKAIKYFIGKFILRKS